MVRDLKIVLLGPTGSGKSTLFHTFIKGIADVAHRNRFTVAWDKSRDKDYLVNLDDEELPKPTVTLLEDEYIAGTMRRFTQQFRLLVTDPPGGYLDNPTDEMLKRTSDCDLMVLVVDPRSLLDQKAEQSVRQAMIEHIRGLRATRAASGGPSPMIAIAFTKSDEYALNGSPPLRCINTERQRRKFRAWVNAYNAPTGIAVNDAWNELLNSLCPPQDTFRMRRKILELSRVLIDEIVVGTQADDKYFNMYFVMSKPGDPHIKPFPWTRRGVNEIFEDFFRIVNEDWTEPAVSVKATMFTLAVSMLVLMAAFTACLFAVDKSSLSEGAAPASPWGWTMGVVTAACAAAVALSALLTWKTGGATPVAAAVKRVGAPLAPTTRSSSIAPPSTPSSGSTGNNE